LLKTYKGHLYKPKSASAVEKSSQSRRSFEALAIAKAKRGNAECGFLSIALREGRKRAILHRIFFYHSFGYDARKVLHNLISLSSL
jgi:hypothetical protein